jgi:hypothetical protein
MWGEVGGFMETLVTHMRMDQNYVKTNLQWIWSKVDRLVIEQLKKAKVQWPCIWWCCRSKTFDNAIGPIANKCFYIDSKLGKNCKSEGLPRLGVSLRKNQIAYRFTFQPCNNATKCFIVNHFTLLMSTHPSP